MAWIMHCCVPSFRKKPRNLIRLFVLTVSVVVVVHVMFWLLICFRHDVLSNTCKDNSTGCTTPDMPAIRQPKWQIRLSNLSNTEVPEHRRFFLTQVLHVRLYKHDKARWTIRELKQWMHYMFYAGVEHIFICDHAQTKSERFDIQIAKYLQRGIVTYIHWPSPKNVVRSKLACYRHFMKQLEDRNEWQTSVDMDEYPFVVKDNSEGFLVRYLKGMDSDVVQVLMENHLMLGQGDRNRSMVIERINRCTPGPANRLTKPLYRVAHTTPGMHRYHERREWAVNPRTIRADSETIRMLHYWGGRLQKWGADTPKVLDMTAEFNTVRRNIAPHVRHSLMLFGEDDAFSTWSGP